MFDLDKIDEYFPFDSFREGQREAIEFALNSFDDGKRIVIIEAPTGSGKSPIGLTLAKFFEKSYYITIQKILQSQIMKEFGSESVVDLRGRANYPCTFYDREGQKMIDRKLMSKERLAKLKKGQPHCGEGFCRKVKKEFKCEFCFPPKTLNNGQEWGALKKLPEGSLYSACDYYEQLYRCMTAPLSLFNFSSFLFQTQYTKGRFEPRDLLIVDECHNLEPELLKFVELSFNDKLLQTYGYSLENFDTPQEYWLDFHEKNIYDVVASVIRHARETENLRLQDEYTNILRKLVIFREAIAKEEEWVSEYKDYGDYREVTLKPVFVKEKSEDYIFRFGKKIILMSATILNVDVFCRSLGITRDQVAAKRMKNRFPVENRRIYVHSYTKVTGGQSKQKVWGPKLLKAANEVIDKYPNDRGIIHTHNFNIARMLVSESKHRKRMLFQHNFKNKDEMLKEHAKTEGSIIVAPAMHEGLDLRGDLSRFQIIAKMPYPNFYDDKQLARRIEIDREYYNWLVALKLVQGYGRSVRNKEDYADTYIIDEGIWTFLKYNTELLPGWFIEAIDHSYKIS